MFIDVEDKYVLIKNNIFKFLRNFIIEWIGSGYSYEFNEKNVYELISKDEIDNIINSMDIELNTDQKLILDIYNKKINLEENFAIPINYRNL